MLRDGEIIPTAKMIIQQNAHRLFKTRHYFFANRLGFIKSIGFYS